MTLSNRLSSSYRPLLILVISLLLVNVDVVNAQNPNPGAPTPDTSSSSKTGEGQSQNDTKGGTDQNAKPTPSADDTLKAKLVQSSWYPIVVSVLFGALLIGFAATIIRVILRSKSSFRSPLGLPEGSLRAMLAFMLVAFLGFYAYASILSLTDLKLPESLLGIVATVIGFYFGSRTSEEKAATPGASGSVEGTVLDSAGAPAGDATVELSKPGGKKLTEKTNPTGTF